jgi:hypothetical protein
VAVCAVFYTYSEYDALKMVSDITALDAAHAKQDGLKPCEVAALTAAKNGAELTECQVLDDDVQIQVSKSRLPLLHARSKAGPSGANCPNLP